MKRKNPYPTREQYLVAAAKIMDTQLLKRKASTQLPERWYVSVMEPTGKVIGRAWPASHDAHHIFVSAVLEDPVSVLATLLHEMIHISVGVAEKHNKVFGAAARAVGLEGKLTATYAGAELTTYLAELNERLAGYPHRPLIRQAALVKRGGKRLKLVSVNDADYHLYIAPKVLESGYPVDPWGDAMEEVG